MPLYLGEASTKRRNQIIGGIAGVLILAFLIAYWQDIVSLKDVISNLIDIVLRKRSLLEWATPHQMNSLLILLFSCGLGFLGVFFFWLILLSMQAILPVDGFVEIYRTAWHMLLFMLRLHGPAVFIRDGIVESTKEDLRKGPGVAFVDFNSAIVLESRTPLPGINQLISNTIHTLLQMIGLAEKAVPHRAAGPGIVFTGRGEQIRGAVDLRKQFRAQPAVTAYTRDGIEVSARIFSIFTIGQKAEELHVTYDGDPKPGNLRVVTMEPIVPGELYRLTGMSDELDPIDRDEIHRFYHLVERSGAYQTYRSPANNNTEPRFDPERVFAAVFSEARAEDKKILPWSELPSRVATGFFREMLSQINFDQLYNIGGPSPIPLLQYKARMRRQMRNNGILDFRLVFDRSRQPLQLRKAYHKADLTVTELTSLTNSKVLRERGIKVFMAGFGDILPVNEAIYKHRLDSWKATWLRDTDIVTAEKDLEAMRLHSRARALAQRDIVTSLNQILRQAEIPQEVLAVRVLQALETLAADSATKDLLPGGTLDVIKATREWLLPGNPLPPSLPPTVDGDVIV